MHKKSGRLKKIRNWFVIDMAIKNTQLRFYFLFFLLNSFFHVSYASTVPTPPIYLLRFGAREGDIGILIGIFSVSSLILRPFVGKAVVTIPEKKFMVAGTLLYIVSCLAYLVAPPFWPLFHRKGGSRHRARVLFNCLIYDVSQYSS